MNNQGRTQLQSIVEGLKQQSAKEAQASRDVQDRTKKEFHDTQMQLSHAMNRADDLDKEVKRLTVKLAEQNKVRVSGVQYRTGFFDGLQDTVETSGGKRSDSLAASTSSSRLDLRRVCQNVGCYD